ncbi:MAG TPA: hypothetical protein VMV31_04675 [Terriglobales bacterium]|nr:hypothetical protein [Terriglobales bacterium]
MSAPELAREMLTGAIDYAGLFPPAQLTMAEAAGNYRHYLQAGQRWALGRFVVPVGRLEELARVLEASGKGEVWGLAALGGSDAFADGVAIQEFNQRHGAWARVEAIEAATPTAKAVATRLAGCAGMACYCELDPGAPGFAEAAEAVHEFDAAAKLRTGGVVAAAIPPAERVAHFLATCHRLELAFKATAGLRHAMRGRHPLSYAPGAPTAVMHGYLNLALAAAWLRAGGTEAEAQAILECDRGEELRFEPEQIVWGETCWTREQVAAGRRFFVGFGSCSFEEPLQWISGR